MPGGDQCLGMMSANYSSDVGGSGRTGLVAGYVGSCPQLSGGCYAPEIKQCGVDEDGCLVLLGA